LTRERLVGHFAAPADSPTEAIIGLHVAAPDETCRWIAIDIDRHHDEDAETNERFAKRILCRALKSGLGAVLVDSSGGRGGFHLWVLFDRPIPMRHARRLVLWLARGWKRHGLPKRPDLFPTNDHLTGERCGTWLRLVGRHHKRASWAKVWSPSGQCWLECDQAIDTILALRGAPVDVSKLVPAEFGRPKPRGRPTAKPRFFGEEEDRELALARDALRFYENDDLDYDDWLQILMALRQFDDAGLKLAHEWSSCSSKYDPKDLEAHWRSLRPGGAPRGLRQRLVTLGTLFKLALDAGWPGPGVHGLLYTVDFRSRGGPVFVVEGSNAFSALDRRGHAAVGLPVGQPCVRKVVRLIGNDERDIVVVGARKPLFDPEPVARLLQSHLGRSIKVIWPREPYSCVASWLNAVETINDGAGG
jgi:hypothetical protein